MNALELYLEKLNVVNNFVSSEMGEVSSDDFNDEEQSRKIYEDRITEEEDVETVEEIEPQFDDNKGQKLMLTPKKKNQWKNLKPLYLRPEKKFVSDELVQAKRCLSPTGAKTAKEIEFEEK